MRTLTFRPDKSVHEKKGEVVQNLMIAVDEEQSHFLDHKKLWYLIKPRFFGILGKKKETSITVHSDETNTLDPFTETEVIDGKEAINLKNVIEDKIQQKTVAEAEKNPLQKSDWDKPLGVAIIVGAVAVAILGIIVTIPYLMNQLGS
tara:strand:- start:3000 stop:3440 length:441 start_codon:yes stop_codon:yes gene_type:complete